MTAEPGETGGVLQWKHPAAISRTRNVLWTMPATVLQSLLPFLFVPVYIRLLGAEAYALVVLNATLLAALAALDGLASPVAIRELGRRNGAPDAAAGMRDALRSLEFLSLGLALVAGLAAAGAAMAILGVWTARSGAAGGLLSAALLMGAAIAAQWPGFLYAASLGGLQRQAVSAGARLAIAVVNHAGGAWVLWLVAADVHLLFAWQVLAFAAGSAALRWLAWRMMPPSPSPPRISGVFLTDVWRFALGSLAAGLAASAMMQLDKLLVARASPPEVFAAYGLSSIVALAACGVVTAPLVSAMQPHLAALHQAGDREALAAAYRRWSQVFALAAVPVLGGLAFSAGTAVDLWLGGASPVGRVVGQLLPVTSIAVLLVALLGPPTALQAAAGWTRLVVASHAASLVVVALALPPILAGHGVVAAAWFNVCVFAAYFVVMAPLALRRLLPGTYLPWLIGDVMLPLAAASGVFLLLRLAFGTPQGLVAALGLAFAAPALAFAALLAILPDGRRQLAQSLRFLSRG